MTDLPSPASAAHPRGARRASSTRSCAHAFQGIAATLLALLACVSIAHADPDPFVFESHAPGDVGGGLAIGVNPVGITFRLLQRTALSEIGIHARGNGTQTVYAALYRIATPDTVPDVAGDSRLVGTTLLQPSTTTADVAGPLAVTLEPGWYAITTGTGRYGATAATWAITLPNVCTTWPCPTQAGQTLGPYTVNATTNARSLQGTTVRIFARGQALPPSLPAPTDFLVESARPFAWKSTQTSGMVSSGRAVAVRFAVDHDVRARHVGAWMFSGSGSIYAAIVRTAGPGANAPFPGTTAFANAVVGSAVFDVGSGADEYGADLADAALAPGSYALVIGSGLFGAEGSALMLSVVDQIVIDDALLWNTQWGPFWAPATPTDHYAVRLAGIVPELAADSVAFGDVPLGIEATRTVTVRNLRAGDLHLAGIALGAGGADGFALGADAAACANATLPAQGDCTFSLHFTPAALGAQAARIDIASDGVPATFAVAASGNGVPAWIVTPSAGLHGSIAPATPQIVGAGATFAFMLTPDPGYHVDAVGGSCGGSLVGNVYTIAAASADCTVEASFALDPPTAFAPVGGSPQSAEVDALFTAPLQVRVTNAAGLGVPGVTVAFAAPASGASALVAAGATTDADGIASVAARANTIAGDYTVSASVAGLAGTASFQLHNEAGAPVQLAGAGGTPQDTVVDSDFAQPLAVRVSDAHDNPVMGVMVAFAAPTSGASAIVAASAPTGADGIALVVARANTVAGSYSVTASSPALPGSASFALQNTAGPPAHVMATGGAGQSAVVESAFAEPLALRVSDAHDNPVGGVAVAFAAPASGASANLSATSVTTGADGRATVTASANAIVGGYVVSATVAGAAESAAFALQNLAPDIALAVAIDDRSDYVAYGDTVVYDVTVSNHGSAIARDVEVAANLPAGIDANAANWSCLDAASGACAAGGSGALLDHATVAANASVHYLLVAPVRADAPGATIEVGASTTGVYAGDIANATDSGWLVVFRNGFDAESGD